MFIRGYQRDLFGPFLNLFKITEHRNLCQNLGSAFLLNLIPNIWKIFPSHFLDFIDRRQIEKLTKFSVQSTRKLSKSLQYLTQIQWAIVGPAYSPDSLPTRLPYVEISHKLRVLKFNPVN